jgi:ketosteroid isomerase-like protein
MAKRRARGERIWRRHKKGEASMSAANKKTALKFLHAMSDADVKGQEECLAPDAFTVTHGFGQVSGQRDRATMLATVDAFKEIVPSGFRPKIHRVTAEADTVVIEWEGDAVLSNGAAYCNQYVFIFTFKHALISRLDEYFCTVLADKVILPLLMQKGEELAHGN